jgi:2-iminobutanoate/2-iminopropanoate deaminase
MQFPARAHVSSIVLLPRLPLSLCAFALLAPSQTQAQVRFLNPSALPAPRGYSHVVEIGPNSRMIMLSGQVPLDSTGRLVGGTNFEAQAGQVFRNLEVGLAAAGASFKDVVKITYYVVNIPAHLTMLRKVRDQYIDTAAPPASTLLQVSGLFRPDVLLEVEVTAVIPATGP